MRRKCRSRINADTGFDIFLLAWKGMQYQFKIIIETKFLAGINLFTIYIDSALI